ncbi:MAG: AlbA family DNA-binding domain-containing protein [Steroidobacteraceae bacterium]
MLSEAELLEMLRDGRTAESSLIERKPDNFKDKEARKVIVAFANSTPEGQEAVLFIGLDDKTGKATGVANTDELQRKYARVLAECYPTIDVRMHVLPFEEKDVVAIVVPASARKPHFAGGAYIREGSRSVLASDRLYEDLIQSRKDKTRELIKYRNAQTVFSVRGINYRLGSQMPLGSGKKVEEIPDCTVKECNGHTVTFFRLDLRESFSEALNRISIEWDVRKNRPRILVVAPGR